MKTQKEIAMIDRHRRAVFPVGLGGTGGVKTGKLSSKIKARLALSDTDYRQLINENYDAFCRRDEAAYTLFVAWCAALEEGAIFWFPVDFLFPNPNSHPVYGGYGIARAGGTFTPFSITVGPLPVRGLYVVDGHNRLKGAIADGEAFVAVQFTHLGLWDFLKSQKRPPMAARDRMNGGSPGGDSLAEEAEMIRAWQARLPEKPICEPGYGIEGYSRAGLS